MMVTAARARDFDRWVRLTLRPHGKRLFVDYADECGTRAGSGEPAVIDGAVLMRKLGDDEPALAGLRKLNSLFPRVLVATELVSWLREGFSDRNETREHLLPEGSQRHTETVPWLLPVFVLPPSLPQGLPWETWVERLLMPCADLGERCVVMRAVPLPPTGALHLPLTLEGVGTNSVALLEGVRQRPWYSRSAAVRQHGLSLIQDDGTWYAGSDIVVRHLGATLTGWRVKRLHRRPRLAVTIAADNPWLRRVDAPEPEPNMSHLLVMPGAGGSSVSAVEIVTHVVYALVHDFSLHEIAWIIRRYVPGTSTWVATDPQANRGLRLSSALRDMIDDVRVRQPHLKPELPKLIADFTYETKGLTAMSNFLARSAELNSTFQSPGPQPPIVFRRGAAAPFMQPQPRRADVTVESYDAFGVLRSMHWHEHRQALLRGWRYRLRIHIGRPDTDTSAVVGDVPNFDNLLPPPDGTARAIEVAVFPKSFELLSSAVATIMLPPEGESAPVHFELRAPQHCGIVDLRIAFYWNNNLLLSYVLEAEVAASNMPTKGSVPLTVRLASAGVDKIDDLARLRPRALSVALNHDVTPGSHTVMIKGTDWHEQVQLNSEEMGKTMDRFRAILEAASSPAPIEFEESVRKLAALGRGIWVMLSVGNRGDVAALDTLRTANDQVLQFVRHGSGRPFPWQTVYDYKLPQGQAFKDASICYADVPPVRALLSGEKGCPHCPGKDVICIEGFWIVRHRMELLSEDLYEGAICPRAERACAPASNPLVLLGVGTSSLASDALTMSLRSVLKRELAEIVPGDAPVAEMLWKEERRPAIFVVLSHLLKGDDDLNLPVRLNAFESDPESDGANISVPALVDLQWRGRWADPQRPIVLLMACESARRDVGELTSLTDTFLASGAAAVAGTEWIVTTEVVADFVQRLIEQTLVAAPQATLGQAIRHFADASLRKKNISAFIFTVYGNADLTVGRP